MNNDMVYVDITIVYMYVSTGRQDSVGHFL